MHTFLKLLLELLNLALRTGYAEDANRFQGCVVTKNANGRQDKHATMTDTQSDAPNCLRNETQTKQMSGIPRPLLRFTPSDSRPPNSGIARIDARVCEGPAHAEQSM